MSRTALPQQLERKPGASAPPWKQQLEALNGAEFAIKSIARSADRRFEQIELQFENAVRELASAEALAPTPEATHCSWRHGEASPCVAGTRPQEVPEAVESRLDVTEQQLQRLHGRWWVLGQAVESRLDVTEQQLQRLEESVHGSGARLAQLEARLAAQDARLLLTARQESEPSPGLKRGGIVERTMALQLDQLSTHIAAISEEDELPRSTCMPEIEALGRDLRQLDDQMHKLNQKVELACESLDDRVSKLNQKVELAFESLKAEIITEKIERLNNRVSASEEKCAETMENVVRQLSAHEARLPSVIAEKVGEKMDDVLQRLSATEARLSQFDQVQFSSLRASQATEKQSVESVAESAPEHESLSSIEEEPF